MEEWLYKISPCLQIVGDEPAPRGWLEAMRVIYEHELVLFTKSDFITEFVTKSGVKKYNCPANSFIIVPPGIRHISRETAGHSGHRHWIHFDWEYAGDHSNTPIMTYSPAKPQKNYYRTPPAYIPAEILHGSIYNPMKVLDLLKRIDNLWNHGNIREQTIARGLLLELLLELLTPKQDSSQQLRDSSSKLASRTRRELNKLARIPLRDALSIEDCLNAIGTTYAHQCRQFKAHYGISPLQYVNELRMGEVKNLLHDTNMPISAIAELTGYDNLGYFSRIFRKHTKMSPREFRNTYQ